MPALAVLGAVCAAQSLLLAQGNGADVPAFGWGSGCRRNVVPDIQYWTAYGGLLCLALALALHWRASRAARRSGLDPHAGWSGRLSLFGAVIAGCFAVVAVFAVFAVTVQGSAIEEGAGLLCVVDGGVGPVVPHSGPAEP